MPTSNLSQLNEITQLIKTTNPSALLDVGIGFGKYGFLAREYLELWDHREKYADWTRRIDGVEAFPGYVGPLQRSIYNTVHIGSALDVLPKLDAVYDLVLVIDVLEHFSREDGLRLLDECLRVSRNVLVAVPKPFEDQGAAFGNEFETHRHDWKRRDFAGFGEKFFLRTRCSLICYLGEDYWAVRRRTSYLGTVRRWFWRMLPKTPPAAVGRSSRSVPRRRSAA